ncbi:MAG: GntR family transcriptional regulator [Kiritimatiellia bacterium]
MVEQVYGGLCADIRSGHYAAGANLPSTRELAEMLGVSRIVTRAAVARLAEAGFVNPRVGSGCIVTGENEKRWRGKVLAILPGNHGNYFANVMFNVLQERLSSAGYIFNSVAVPELKRDVYELSRIDIELCRHYNLVMTVYNKDPIVDYLEVRGIPYISLMANPGTVKNALGAVIVDYNGLVDRPSAACRERGVRSVLQVAWPKGMADATKPLRQAGIKVKTVLLKVNDYTQGLTHGIEVAGFKDFLARDLSSYDLVFFNDDNLARGALLSMTSRGICAPRDIKVVSWSNFGMAPVYLKELTRMELNPIAGGEKIAEMVLKHLQTGRCENNVVLTPEWIAGETI